MARDLVDRISNLDETGALECVEQALAANANPEALLDQAREGLRVVGQRFADGEYFLPELVFSGQIIQAIVERLKPLLTVESTQVREPQVVLGTVAGDIHDIGKNLVKFMLDVSGIGVLDLGVNVAPQQFVDAVRQTGTGIVALSGFLTIAFQSMRQTIEAFSAAGLRDRVKVMVGGGQVDEQVTRHIGADAFGNNAMDAVKLAQKWLGA